jgi:hypothetical protein
MKRSTVVNRLDKLDNFTEKLKYLHGLFLKAKTEDQEEMILDIIKRLKNGF